MTTVLTSNEAERERLYWTVDLGKGRPAQRWAVIAAAFAAGLAGLLLLRSPLAALLGFAVVIASCSELFIPLKYSLSAERATVRCGLNTSEMFPDRVRSIVEDAGGVKLSPLAPGGRMEPFRGVYLRFGENRTEIMRIIADYWRPADGPVG